MCLPIKPNRLELRTWAIPGRSNFCVINKTKPAALARSIGHGLPINSHLRMEQNGLESAAPDTHLQTFPL